MASLIKYLVLEVDNQEIIDVQRFVLETVPRTPHMKFLADKDYGYDVHVQPLGTRGNIGAKLHFVEVVIHGVDSIQPDPYIVVYRESVNTAWEEADFLLRRISKILVRLTKVSGMDFITLSATGCWNVLALKGQMEKFDQEFRKFSKLGTIK